jgi:hypothetical protein
MPKKEMASSTSGFILVRSLSGTIGVAVFQSVVSTQLLERYPSLPGYGTDFTIPTNQAEYQILQHLPEAERVPALSALSKSLQASFLNSPARLDPR